MVQSKKIRIALPRGDSLREQEAQISDELGAEFESVFFCGKKNIFPTGNIKSEVRRLPSSTDNFILKNFYKYIFGHYQHMFGLEKKLAHFDIVHAGELFNYYTLQAVRAKKLNSKLRVVANYLDNTFGRFEYNYWPGFSSPPKYWRDKINATIKECVKGVDKFLSFTHYSTEVLYSLGVRPEQVEVFYHPTVIEDRDDHVLERFNLTEGGFYLVICRMIWEKGIYDILYAWKIYVQSPGFVERKLVVIGDGKEAKNFKRLVYDLGLQDSIVILGNVPNSQTRQLYKYAKAFILASLSTRTWQEQCPYVIMEALTFDCPVICTASGGNKELAGDAGLIVQPGNPIELKNALIKMEDPVFYQQLKKACLKEKMKFDFADYKKRLINFYKSVL